MRKKHNIRRFFQKNILYVLTGAVTLLVLLGLPLVAFSLYDLEPPQVFSLIANQVMVPLTCTGEHEFVSTNYPGLHSCSVRYADAGTLCTNGEECQSGFCVLSADDEQRIRTEIMQRAGVVFPYPKNALLVGQCLDSHEKDQPPAAGCRLTLTRGKVAEFKLCE